MQNRLEQSSFLSIDDQDKVINKLFFIASHSPFREKILYEYGSFSATMCMIAGNFTSWKIGFKVFNLSKFGKYRTLSLLIPSIISAKYGLFYMYFVSKPIYDHYREESALYYGIRSLLTYQFAAPILSTFTIGYSFVHAQMLGMIPLDDTCYNKGNRLSTLKFVLERVRPYTKRLAITHLACSLVMFSIGLGEYQTSVYLLSKVGRKTLCQRECDKQDLS